MVLRTPQNAKGKRRKVIYGLGSCWHGMCVRAGRPGCPPGLRYRDSRRCLFPSCSQPGAYNDVQTPHLTAFEHLARGPVSKPIGLPTQYSLKCTKHGQFCAHFALRPELESGKLALTPVFGVFSLRTLAGVRCPSYSRSLPFTPLFGRFHSPITPFYLFALGSLLTTLAA